MGHETRTDLVKVMAEYPSSLQVGVCVFAALWLRRRVRRALGELRSERAISIATS